MCRCIEGDESETLKEIYQEQFIQRGEQLNDPFLVNIGHWQRKEVIKAVNQFAIDNTKLLNISNIFKNVPNLNLYPYVDPNKNKSDS